jgi:uncharacterized phage protein (TIGR02220 family)
MRVEPELRDHPKFLRLKKIVGDGAMEYLVAIWGHCQSNQRGEFWAGADADYVEMICRWDGEAGVLFNALCDCGKPGFIERTQEGVHVHDWAEMNSQMVSNWSRNTNGRKGKKPTGSQREANGIELPEGGSGAGSGRVQGGSQREASASPVLTPTGTQQEADALSIQSFSHSPTPSAKLPYAEASALVTFLNELTGAKFRGTHAELTAMAQCLFRVNGDVEGVKKMLRRQTALWKGDAKSAAWLRPLTLFDAEKFDGYYAQRELPLTTATGPQKNAPEKNRPALLEQLSQARARGDEQEIADLTAQLQTA